MCVKARTLHEYDKNAASVTFEQLDHFLAYIGSPDFFNNL